MNHIAHCTLTVFLYTQVIIFEVLELWAQQNLPQDFLCNAETSQNIIKSTGKCLHQQHQNQQFRVLSRSVYLCNTHGHRTKYWLFFYRNLVVYLNLFSLIN